MTAELQDVPERCSQLRTGLHALEQGKQDLLAPRVLAVEAEDGAEEGASWASFLRSCWKKDRPWSARFLGRGWPASVMEPAWCGFLTQTGARCAGRGAAGSQGTGRRNCKSTLGWPGFQPGSDCASPLAAPGETGEWKDAMAPARDCLWGPVSLAHSGDTTFCCGCVGMNTIVVHSVGA